MSSWHPHRGPRCRARDGGPFPLSSCACTATEASPSAARPIACPSTSALLIYIDALMPRDGQSALDLWPEWFGAEARATVDHRRRVPMPAVLEPREGWVRIGETERLRYLRRLRPQPLASFTEPICGAARSTVCPPRSCAARARLLPVTQRRRRRAFPRLAVGASGVGHSHDAHVLDPTAPPRRSTNWGHPPRASPPNLDLGEKSAWRAVGSGAGSSPRFSG